MKNSIKHIKGNYCFNKQLDLCMPDRDYIDETFFESKIKKITNKKDIVIQSQYRYDRYDNQYPEPSEKAERLCIVQSINFWAGARNTVDKSKTSKLKAKLLQKVREK